MGLGRARKEASVRGEGTGDFDPTSSILWPPNRPFPSQPLERAEVTPLSPIQKKKKIFFPVISEGIPPLNLQEHRTSRVAEKTPLPLQSTVAWQKPGGQADPALEKTSGHGSGLWCWDDAGNFYFLLLKMSIYILLQINSQ